MSNLAKNFVLFSDQFGFPMYIADSEKSIMPITDRQEEALHFEYGYDNPNTKLGYYSALTGYDLKIVEIN